MDGWIDDRSEEEDPHCHGICIIPEVVLCRYSCFPQSPLLVCTSHNHHYDSSTALAAAAAAARLFALDGDCLGGFASIFRVDYATPTTIVVVVTTNGRFLATSSRWTCPTATSSILLVYRHGCYCHCYCYSCVFFFFVSFVFHSIVLALG